MRAALLEEVGKLTLVERDVPVCPPDGLLVRVASCGVCTTDVKIYNYGHHKISLPRVLGHELAGVIEEVGPQVQTDGTRYSAGTRVAVCAVINCGECRYCMRGVPSMCERLQAFGYHYDGGYQEHIQVPAVSLRCGGVHPIPENVSDDEAAVAELLACCINGQSLSDVRFGESMLIMGAGPVGIIHAQLAAARGCAPVYISDIVPQKLEVAKRIVGDGLTGTFDARDGEGFERAAAEATGGYGFDQVMIATGVPVAQQAAIRIVAKMGYVNFFGGLPKGKSDVVIDTNEVHYKQCRVVGTHGSSALENRMAIDMIAKGQIDLAPLVTHRIGIDELEGLLKTEQKGADYLKAVVAW
ncbi:MAG: alcohol dehydrogenase [Spirochaetaceae bacterium]|nr:MAG: alcohol dehydrogenase [Spirochaetaceae bacterium]